MDGGCGLPYCLVSGSVPVQGLAALGARAETISRERVGIFFGGGGGLKLTSGAPVNLILVIRTASD